MKILQDNVIKDLSTIKLELDTLKIRSHENKIYLSYLVYFNGEISPTIPVDRDRINSKLVIRFNSEDSSNKFLVEFNNTCGTLQEKLLYLVWIELSKTHYKSLDVLGFEKPFRPAEIENVTAAFYRNLVSEMYSDVLKEGEFVESSENNNLMWG